MKIIEYKSELIGLIEELKKQEKTIGLVPTMGALHEGHMSLLKEAKRKSDITVVSIFVNPTQFNDKKDYDKYPRVLSEDINQLEKEKCDILFFPSKEEMYPEKDLREFDFGNLDKVMEGKFRPGHFNGVAQIVSKLFDIVQPHKAYFGEKDFQQVTIIKHLTRVCGYNLEIVVCPTIREKDGLALSSRNRLLSENERKNVSIISQTLFEAKEKGEKLKIQELKQWVIEKINNSPLLKVEYFEIVNEINLEPVGNWEQPVGKVGCIAVHVGGIRLIDNIRFYS